MSVPFSSDNVIQHIPQMMVFVWRVMLWMGYAYPAPVVGTDYDRTDRDLTDSVLTLLPLPYGHD